ncbi:hypothetical protein M407DRAFT_17993 [Tulasnella calospora MUT 4182]|uniref:Uncharacterized protein n=1 Tax=Tulasnella calospora MUT 4182 TaxID=1051891 RepID=A0A0C3L7M7_9AGAM|nr:hypothetical protein M407DRAFT_32817 [Tulasnella calospora MUT 4182]KIO33128.1 hypothetical protein M407DRAFT_17993 [Tulasnella calospora MUT 4182]
MAWIWVILCMLSATVASSVLAARLWALYERDRRVLAALIIGFLACLVPGWTLTFRGGSNSIDPNEFRVIGNVFTYIGGVTVQEGVDALDWRFKKCYHLSLSKISISILIGSLLYESGIFAALLWKMCRDQKRTRIMEAFYRDGVIYYVVIFANYAVAIGNGFAWNDPLAQAFLTSAFYVGVKSMACAHIILRLRSYFSFGDAVVDGRVETNLFDEGGKVGEHSLSSSLVSTIIHFAHMISGNGGTTFEIRSDHLVRGEERRTADLESVVEAADGRGRTPNAPGLPPPTPLRQSLDWMRTAGLGIRRPAFGDATSESDSIVSPSANGSSPHRPTRRPKWFGKGRRTSAHAQSQVEENSGFGERLWGLAAVGSRDEPLTTVEMDNLSREPRNIGTAGGDHEGRK